MAVFDAPPSADLRDRLLLAMLQTAPAQGWNALAMAAAARLAGLTPGEAALAAPGGAIELADAFALWADDRMADRLAGRDLASMKIRERVTFAVRARIEALAAHRDAVRRAAAALALAGPTGPSARIAWRTADRIWTALGDRSTDENYYSKRAILAGVHAAVLGRWLMDDGPGAEATWRFLDRRIDGVMQFEKLKARLKPVSLVADAAVGALARLRYGLARG